MTLPAALTAEQAAAFLQVREVRASQHRGRWQAQIVFDGVRKHLGVFDTRDQTHAAYLVAKAAVHSFQNRPRG